MRSRVPCSGRVSLRLSDFFSAGIAMYIYVQHGRQPDIHMGNRASPVVSPKLPAAALAGNTAAASPRFSDGAVVAGTTAVPSESSATKVTYRVATTGQNGAFRITPHDAIVCSQTVVGHAELSLVRKLLLKLGRLLLISDAARQFRDDIVKGIDDGLVLFPPGDPGRFIVSEKDEHGEVISAMLVGVFRHWRPFSAYVVVQNSKLGSKITAYFDDAPSHSGAHRLVPLDVLLHCGKPGKPASVHLNTGDRL